MTDLQKIQDQLEKAMSELKELEIEETQLAYDYIEYANILVKNLIIGDVVGRSEQLKCGFCSSDENVEEIPVCDKCWDGINNH